MAYIQRSLTLSELPLEQRMQEYESLIKDYKDQYKPNGKYDCRKLPLTPHTSGYSTPGQSPALTPRSASKSALSRSSTGADRPWELVVTIIGEIHFCHRIVICLTSLFFVADLYADIGNFSYY